MTQSEPPIQSWSLRSLPPLTWAMVVLGLVFVSTSFNGRQLSLLAMLAGLAPFLFAATVTYMKPADPRFLYGAVLIGVGRGLSMLAILIASQGVVRGEFANVLFDVTAFVDTPIELAGIFLLALGAGGIRSRVGLGILGLGALIAVLSTAWYVANVVTTLSDTLGLVDIATVVVVALLFPIAWAFTAGAAFESRKRLLLLGSLAMLGLEGVVLVLTLANLGPGTDFSRVSLVVQVLQIIGWLILAVSPLRLEMGTQRPLRDEVPATPG